MQDEVKKQKIESKQKYIKKAQTALDNLNQLKTALETWDKKLVDKRFFLQHFKMSNEYRDWTKFSLSTPRYSFCKHSHEIYITSDYYLELDNRETAHILSKINDMLARLTSNIESWQNDIKTLNSFDEKQLVKELQALYSKYNQPEIWGEVLNRFEVKYPKG